MKVLNMVGIKQCPVWSPPF